MLRPILTATLLSAASALSACSTESATEPGDTSVDAELGVDVPSADASPLDAGPIDATDVIGDTDAPAAPAALECAAFRGARVCSATLDPTLVDVAVDPVATGVSGRGDDGSHWFCRPEDSTTWNGRTLLYLVGTYSNPADDHRLAEHACSEGWAAVVPMYENRDDPRGVCRDDSACYDAFHREALFGEPGAPGGVDVAPASGIDARTRGLVSHLARGADADGPWGSVTNSLTVDDWTSIAVAGHSQGAGHATYLGGERTAERIIMLAGPSDRIGDGTPEHAPVDWITAFDPATPIDRHFGYIHQDDGIANVAQIVANWASLSLPAESCDQRNEPDYPEACRRIFAPAMGCGQLLAHAVPVVRAWTNTCFPLASGAHDNDATWSFLLDAGL